LTAVCRAAGIPALLGFADVRNHLQTETLRALMGGTDLFVYHGYSRLYIEGRWLKATPAFNVELCARFGVPPVEFDGDRDALMHAFTADGAQHMEYVRERGVFDDLPLNAILTVLRHAYGPTIFTGAHPLDDVFTGRTRPDETPGDRNLPRESR
jgi:transglutaminase-like putative cysteine protease